MKPDAVEGVMRELRRAREEILVHVPVARVVQAVDRVARRLLDPEDDLRIALLPELAREAGYSPGMAREVLGGMARDWTRGALEGLLASEFPDPGVLDGFRPAPRSGRIRALGYPVVFHLGAGSVPGVATTSLVRALLAKSASLLKPGSGNRALPGAFLEGLREADPELARGVAVHYWAGEEESPATGVALGAADLVVVYGGDETAERIRSRLPAAKQIRVYRHRMGIGLVGRDALKGGGREEHPSPAEELAKEVARAVALFDQRGCVSPQVVFVEEGGNVSPGAWAGVLAGALELMEDELPSGPLPPTEGAALQQLRGAGEMAAAAGEGAIYHGGSRAPWTLLLARGGGVEPTCLNRTVRLVPVPRLEDTLPELEARAAHLQTVGVAGLGERAGPITEALARLGVSRVVGFSAVPWPRPWWHHDGEGPLRALVRWTDAE